jgi:hypothetical protein
MAQKTVATSLTPSVNIQAVQGSLQVKGWDRPQVLVRATTRSRPKNRTTRYHPLQERLRCPVTARIARSPPGPATPASSCWKASLIDQILGSLEPGCGTGPGRKVHGT